MPSPSDYYFPSSSDYYGKLPIVNILTTWVVTGLRKGRGWPFFTQKIPWIIHTMLEKGFHPENVRKSNQSKNKLRVYSSAHTKNNNFQWLFHLSEPYAYTEPYPMPCPLLGCPPQHGGLCMNYTTDSNGCRTSCACNDPPSMCTFTKIGNI